jgi:hypothetical protein
MEELQKIYSSNPKTKEISLASQEIKDLAELLPLLSQFRELAHLDLSNNGLIDIPKNMSCLANLEKLNVNGNLFKDTYQAVDCLSSLPALLSLNINLNEEEQVDYIMKCLPELQILNDLQVERDSEDEESEEDDEIIMEETSENMHHHDVHHDNALHDHLKNERMHDDMSDDNIHDDIIRDESIRRDENIRHERVHHQEPPTVILEKLLSEDENEFTDAFNEVRNFQ